MTEKTNPFDYVKSITETKVYMMETLEDEKSYNAFLTNRALSFYPDTLMHAIEMNKYPKLDSKMQYDYLYYSVRKMRRKGSKWPKPPSSEDLDLLKEYYDYSDVRAMEVLPLHSVEDLKEIREALRRGGVEK